MSAPDNEEIPLDRYMIDIETLGLVPGATLLSIGACKWTVENSVQETFYVELDSDSCRKAGLTPDQDTLEWWQEQEDIHRPNGSVPLSAALEQLADFISDADEVWAHSPSFDLAHLEHCYDCFEMDYPWNYKIKRDSRTIAALPIAMPTDHSGQAHHALDDAKHQAEAMAEALQALSKPIQA